MIKIIELEIDPELSGDTGVFEVAWVEYPAIEQDLIFFGRQKFYKATEEVSRKACRAIQENEKRGNPAATQTGKVRAQQLCNRDEISLETIKRMKSYLERAETYYTGDYDDNGTISYDLWGGKPALEWVDGILSKIVEEKMDITPNPCWKGYEPYGLKPNGDPNCIPIKQSKEDFVYPSSSETKDEFISRCIPYVMREGKTQDEASGQCYGMWDNREFAFEKVSFDWDGTLSTGEGKKMLEKELRMGNEIHIITARPRLPDELISLSNKYRIPARNLYSVGSNLKKVELVQKLGIKRHYDDNPEVRRMLGQVGQSFDYITNLPNYQNTSGNTMEIKPVLMSEDCGCSKSEEFNLLGFIDGSPVFSTPQEADVMGQALGCGGHHEHITEDGNVVYMPCEIHPEVDIEVEDFSEYSEEQVEAFHLLKFLRENHREEFERVSPTFVGGMTYQEVIQQNYKTTKRLYRYDRVDSGEPTRDFCSSIEGFYFDRFSIDQMRYVNTEFGHNKQPYSKWLYKGGPNCIHAWRPFEAKGRTLNSIQIDLGQAGIPPKQMVNNGYYSPESKRRSEVAYIISQQRMSKQMELSGEFLPLDYMDGFPIYDDLVTAQDVSYLLGCGGITEQVSYGDRMVFQSCSTNMKKQEMTKNQMFSANEEKRMIYTPLMIPNILIPRLSEDGEKYFVKFTPETIELISQKFAIEQRNRHTNLEHSDKKFNDVVMVESWIVQGDKDKSYELGFTKEQIPMGTWFGGFKVLDTPEGNMIWEKLIKPGKVKGASVEGNFLLNFSQEKRDEYLLSTIINILKNITD
jgi:hypothetical protein